MELTELSRALGQLEQAQCLEDIFGSAPDEEQVKKRYRVLAMSLHPDGYARADREVQRQAEEGFKLLADAYEKALSAIETGLYGKRAPLSGSHAAAVLFTVESGGAVYTAETLLAEGEVSNVYVGYRRDPDGGKSPVCFKLSFGESPAEIRSNNLMLRRESDSLKKLWAVPGNPNLSHLPQLLAQFQSSDRALGNILSLCKGLDCCEIRRNPLYTAGVPAVHLFWILSRCLTTLGYVHGKGLIHGNIEPAHLVINPVNHNVSLIDWCYSLGDGDAVRAYTEGFSPPEVESRLSPTPSADIYSLGKTILFLAGDGDGRPRLPEGLEKLLQGMTLESVMQRPRNALELNEYVKKLRVSLYGDQGFVPFPV